MEFDTHISVKTAVSGIPEDSGSCQRFCEGPGTVIDPEDPCLACSPVWSISLVKGAVSWRSNAITKLRRKDEIQHWLLRR